MKDWTEGPLVPGDFVTRSAEDTSLVGNLEWYYILDKDYCSVMPFVGIGSRALAGLQFSYKFRRTFSINLGVTLDWTGFVTK